MRLIGIFFFATILNHVVPAQDNMIDGVIGLVGEELILKSELEEQYAQFISQGYEVEEGTRCYLYEQLLFQKLLLAQAAVDSVEVGEVQVDMEMERRLRYFVSQFGDEAKLEEFYNKTIEEIKEEFRAQIKDQMVISQMQQTLTAEIKITPVEVKEFYQSIPEDSLPYINAEIEVAQIVRKAPVGDREKEKTRKKLEEIRDRILRGEDFGTLAYLYSEDPGSAASNGSLGFMSRDELVPEFAGVAFKMDIGDVSDIVETKFGFHLIKPIAKKGQRRNIAHILLIPKVQPSDMLKAKNYVDSIKKQVVSIDTLTFDLAAKLFSDDKMSKYNGGLISNPVTGGTKFEMDQISQIDPTLYVVIEKMNAGDMSEPEVAQLDDGSKGYRIVKLVSYTSPHRANLGQDYQRISEFALSQKQQRELEKWISKSNTDFYIKTGSGFTDCEFKYNWKTQP